MDRETINELVKQKPGYEVVYKLLHGPERRNTLAEYVGTDGGTLHSWLNDAENEGLISRKSFLHEETDEKWVRYRLEVDLPDDIRTIVLDRGSQGPRDTNPDFADTAKIHYWDDEHSLDNGP